MLECKIVYLAASLQPIEETCTLIADYRCIELKVTDCLAAAVKFALEGFNRCPRHIAKVDVRFQRDFFAFKRIVIVIGLLGKRQQVCGTADLQRRL